MAALEWFCAGLVVGVWNWENKGGVFVAGKGIEGKKDDVALVLATLMVIKSISSLCPLPFKPET